MNIISNEDKLKLFNFEDKLRIIKIIKNIVKGTFEAKKYFKKQHGISLFHLIIKGRDEDENLESHTAEEIGL